MTSRPSPRPAPANEPPPDEPLPNPAPDPDQAWKALNLVNDWIRHAEAKTGATLAAAGVTGGVLYNLVKDQEHLSGWLCTVAVLCGVAIVACALCATIALVPRLSISSFTSRLGIHKRRPEPTPGGQPPPEDPASVLFFAHIARDYKHDDAPTYAQVLATLTSNPRQLTEQIGHQVHQNAHVARRKYRWSTGAIVTLVADLLLLGVTALLVAHR